MRISCWVHWVAHAVAGSIKLLRAPQWLLVVLLPSSASSSTEALPGSHMQQFISGLHALGCHMQPWPCPWPHLLFWTPCLGCSR